MKNIIITGVSSGIGLAIAEKLLSKGHRVAGLSRRTEKMTALQEQYGDKFLSIACDVTKPEEVENAKQKALAAWNSVDVLINNAGVGYLGKMEETPLSEWHQMFDVNVNGLMTCIHTFQNSLFDARGQIINIDSVAGHEVYPEAVVYCATKHAVRALSVGMEKEFKGRIKITNISPGAVETEFHTHTTHPEKSEQMEKQFSNVLKADDIARAVDFAIDQPGHVAINELTIRPFK